MAYSYNLKIVVSGQQVEVYNYKKQIWRDFEKKTQKKDTSKREPKQLDILETIKNKKEKQQYSLNRTKKEIKRLVNANPQLNKFMTLTFADNITNVKQANYLFNQFIKRIAYRYTNFKYLAVLEFQKRGAIHYHIVCNLPFIEMDALEYTWGHGMVNIRKLDKVSNQGAYMSKYLGKELFSGRMFSKKKFFRSQTLNTSIEIFNWLAQKFIEKFLQLLDPVFESSFESEWAGEVEYSAYSLKFLPFKNGIFSRRVVLSSV